MLTLVEDTPETPYTVIELRNCSRGFGSAQVLRDISLEIRRGETLALIGESGCGKSVTTKLIATLLEPSAGEVRWEGRSIHDRSPEELRRDRLRLGYLFQGAALFDSLNIYENVAFGLQENTSLKPHEMRPLVLERLKEVGLPPSVCTKRPAELSGGMRKRAALARALILSPDVMIYDEPTTGLDPVMSDVINELILQIRSVRPVTSIVVTHDMTTVKRVADRVVMLYPLSRIAPDAPQVIFRGTTEEAFASTDLRIKNFVEGNARERLQELMAS